MSQRQRLPSLFFPSGPTPGTPLSEASLRTRLHDEIPIKMTTEEIFENGKFNVDSKQIKTHFRDKSLIHKKRIHEYTQACTNIIRAELYTKYNYVPIRLRNKELYVAEEAYARHFGNQKAQAAAKIHTLMPLIRDNLTPGEVEEEWLHECQTKLFSDNPNIANINLKEARKLLTASLLTTLDDEALKYIKQRHTRTEKADASLRQTIAKTERFIRNAVSRDTDTVMEDMINGNDSELHSIIQAQAQQIKVLTQQFKNFQKQNKLLNKSQNRSLTPKKPGKPPQGDNRSKSDKRAKNGQAAAKHARSRKNNEGSKKANQPKHTNKTKKHLKRR